jgi:AhpD family alkylhydroperoxidase
MSKLVTEFNDYRQRMNERLLEDNNLLIKRIYNLDSQAYQPGALPSKTKELLGLISSLVLRCNDCVKYHIGRSRETGVTKEEFMETISIGILVGGTIVIPHARVAVEYWDELEHSI